MSRRLLRNDVYRRLCRARDFMHEHHDEPLVLATVARQAELSPYHFLRTFHAAFDETPHEFLTRMRLERAKELLVHTDMRVTEICFEVGFESLGSFSTLFSKRIGASPIVYRRSMHCIVQTPSLLVARLIPLCFVRMFTPLPVADSRR